MYNNLSHVLENENRCKEKIRFLLFRFAQQKYGYLSETQCHIFVHKTKKIIFDWWIG